MGTWEIHSTQFVQLSYHGLYVLRVSITAQKNAFPSCPRKSKSKFQVILLTFEGTRGDVFKRISNP